MHKVMALDVGTKRIGIALSDYLQVIATPHSFISRVPEEKAIEEIIKIAKKAVEFSISLCYNKTHAIM